MAEPGVLYVVATPLGNLGDMSPRAVAVLQAVDLIAAEDTRHSGPLLAHFGISTPVWSLHAHNEAERSGALLGRLREGASVALISDAGTPLVSDPGFPLVREARAQGIRVTPIPGPSALIAAVSASGLPVDRFVFEGFLPAKSGARRARLAALVQEPRTLVFYEAPHRIKAMVADLAAVFGDEREAALAREITKRFETFLSGTLAELMARLEADPDQSRGEFVVLVHGAPEPALEEGVSLALEELLGALLEVLPVKQAVQTAVRLTGRRRNEIYKLAMTLRPNDH